MGKVLNTIMALSVATCAAAVGHEMGVFRSGAIGTDDSLISIGKLPCAANEVIPTTDLDTDSFKLVMEKCVALDWCLSGPQIIVDESFAVEICPDPSTARIEIVEEEDGNFDLQGQDNSYPTLKVDYQLGAPVVGNAFEAGSLYELRPDGWMENSDLSQILQATLSPEECFRRFVAPVRKSVTHGLNRLVMGPVSVNVVGSFSNENICTMNASSLVE